MRGAVYSGPTRLVRLPSGIERVRCRVQFRQLTLLVPRIASIGWRIVQTLELRHGWLRPTNVLGSPIVREFAGRPADHIFQQRPLRAHVATWMGFIHEPVPQRSREPPSAWVRAGARMTAPNTHATERGPGRMSPARCSLSRGLTGGEKIPGIQVFDRSLIDTKNELVWPVALREKGL